VALLLPYTVNQSTVADGTTLYLSTETKGPSNEPLSSTWVRFTRDYFTNGPHSAPFDHRTQSNRRLRMSRTYEGALADGRYRQTKFDTTTFDGAGHHRKTTTTSYFGPTPAEQPNSVSIVNYNPGSSCSNPEASGCSYSLPSTSSRWILGRFDHRQIEDADPLTDDAARVDYDFDPATGFLRERRTRLAEDAIQNSDIRVLYTDNADGSVAREEWFGGDNGNQTTPTYALGYVYASGLPTETRYLDPTNLSSVLMSLGQKARDPYTGVALSKTDPNGLEVTYSYDELLRLTLEQDTSPNPSVRLGWTSYEYTFGGTALGSTNLVRKKSSSLSLCPSGPSSCFSYREQSESHLDGFGRSVLQRAERAPGVWSKRYDVYDTSGRLTVASSWGADSTGGGETLYQNFDVHGRPQRIVAPDAVTNPDHVVDIAYTGSRQTVTTSRIGTTFSGPEMPFSTTRKFDPSGRLIEIADPIAQTQYRYSSAGRLTSITQRQLVGTSSQVRTYNYDDRGFLTQESHPEGGPIFYKAYDARGHLLAKRAGVDSPTFEVAYLLDSTERVREVTMAGVLARRFTYDEPTGGAYALGKLTTAESWNSFAAYSDSMTITERRTYDGRGGAISQKKTLLNFNGVDRGNVVQSFTWNDAGELSSEAYPTWTLAPSAPSRTISYGYGNGRLSSVSGFATAITYHDNFELASIAHSNGVTDWIGKDPHGLPRPREIHTTGVAANQNWHSGVFEFDGVQNLRGTGGHRYRYDSVSRIAGAQLQLPEAPSVAPSFEDGFERGSACNWDYRTPEDVTCSGELTREAVQTLAFDAYGNLTATTTEGTTLNIPANVSNNRLLTATYDERGNVSAWSGNSYSYDRLNQLQEFHAGGQHRLFAYDAHGERVAATSPVSIGGPGQVKIRSLSGQVLREFRLATSLADPTWSRDWIYRGSAVLAVVVADGSGETPSHLTLDHLGSPRLITDEAGAKLAEHVYWPFGVEATTFDQDDLEIKFTGHERDLGDPSSASDDHDYMHARTYNPLIGRFLQCDPAGVRVGDPRALNRYAYVSGNPLANVDPDGRSLAALWKRIKRWFGGGDDSSAPGGGAGGSSTTNTGSNTSPGAPGAAGGTTGAITGTVSGSDEIPDSMIPPEPPEPPPCGVNPITGTHGFSRDPIGSVGHLRDPRGGGGEFLSPRPGDIHGALDIAADINRSPVYAYTDGTVERASWYSKDAGYNVLIDHDNGDSTSYSHLQAGSIPPNVYPGARVNEGQVIGTAGDTGNARGFPGHVHFTYRESGTTKIDPVGPLNAPCWW
jgi:RHS repeat-associated protein